METGFWDIFASCILWSPAQFCVRIQLPGQILSFLVVLPLFSRMCEATDGGQPLQTWLKHRWQHLCAGLVEQRLCFGGMKSFPLPRTCYMRQVPNGCLMMSGGNCWKNREKLKSQGSFFFFFLFFPFFSMYFAWALLQLFTYFHRSSAFYNRKAHLSYCSLLSLPLFLVAKGK